MKIGRLKRGLKNLLFRRGTAVFHDLLMIPLAWLLGYWLRFNLGEVPGAFLYDGIRYLLIIVPVQASIFWAIGLYRGVWRFASLPDLMRILKGTLVGLVVNTAVLFVVFRLEGVPRSVPILYGLLLVILLSGPRFVYRWVKDHRIRFAEGKRVLVVGAGGAGEMLVRDMLRDRSTDYFPVAFVDDAAWRLGQELHGVPVVAACDRIPQVVKALEIDVIVLAVPSADLKARQRLVTLCDQAGVPLRMVPQLGNVMAGQVVINQLREVSIEDLLGRKPVELDWGGIRKGLSGRSILVTGAGGSIGSELCRQIAELAPGRLILFEDSEYNLYSIELELRRRLPDMLLHACLGDLRDPAGVERIFERFRPEVVFHAAAYKHVPMLEYQVREAVRNNVLGTCALVDTANRFGCADFVMISTDKAVNPANVMGATKRVAEIYCQNLDSRSQTRFVTVRFGNVLGSAGSVVPLFRKQIAEGGPVTVTHPEIERFFMTIPEASRLIMQSGVMGRGGEIFVLDMGDSVNIRDLAEQMIRLSGKTPGKDIEITYTGLRPGEKLFEELFHEQEALQSTPHDKILLAGHRVVDWDELKQRLIAMERAVQACDEKFLLQSLWALVPEHRMEPAPPEQGDS